MANYDDLVNAHIIDASNPPSQADKDTINGLNATDVAGLIKVFGALNAQFLIRNCGGANATVAPQQGVRTIGIVF
jgi:hypothetical protein